MSKKLKKQFILAVKPFILAVKIAGGTVIIVCLVGWFIGTDLVRRWHVRSAHATMLYERGPWSGEAVWISEDESMYVVGQYDERPYNPHLEVTMYLLSDGEWLPWRMGIEEGSFDVSFYYDTDDTDRRFTCWGDIEDEGRLVLTKFSESAAEYLPEGTKKIVLTRYDYEDHIGHVPFPVTRF